MKNILLILFLIFLNKKAFSLVDYSETENTNFRPKTAKKSNYKAAKTRSAVTSRAKAPSSKASTGSSFMKMMEFGTSFKNSNVDLSSGEVNFSTFDFYGHIQTPYNFYVDFSYAVHSSDSDYLSDTASSQAGNPKFLIGLNWLTFGGGADMTTIDLIAGVRASEVESNFATSRNDKIVALETTKRFYNFVLGLGYEVNLTGSPKNSLERDVGNISRLYSKIGIEVSQDIRFLIAAESIKIANNSNSGHSLALNEDLSYGIVSPKLVLGITPMVNMQLGGVFRTKRLDNIDNITNARLFHLDGIYGNSLVAGLDINL